MKNKNNIPERIRVAGLIKCSFALLFSILLFGCEDDEILDDRDPTIQVVGVTKDEIIETPYSSEGYPLNLIIADNAGLSSYSIGIDSASVNVFSFESSDLKHKLEHETVLLNDIGIGYLYDVSIVVTDVNSKTSNFQFKLRVTDFLKFEYLGLVGDGTMAGWNPAASEAMRKDLNDPAIFTYEGTLTATGEGAIKIATFKGDWCDGKWLYASVPNKPLTLSDSFVINDCGGPDNKWQVTEQAQGQYLVTVNLRDNSISFEKQ